jgi:hypothetical protein
MWVGHRHTSPVLSGDSPDSLLVREKASGGVARHHLNGIPAFAGVTVTALLSLVTIGLVMLLTSTASAQTRGHQHPDFRAGSPPHIPPVRYSFRGEVKPESLLVRGLLEVEYRNRTDDSVGEVQFFTGIPIHDPHDTSMNTEPPYMRLDSMLCYGVPLSKSELIIDDRTITAVLPRPLAPGAKAFFIMTFETHLGSGADTENSSTVVYTGWYPRVAGFRGGRWYTPTEGVIDQSVPEFADFTMALKIDSAYSLVYPGELVNDKEHYGLLPPAHNDSVYVDIVNQHQQEYAGIKYHPLFESGHKNFYIRSKNDIDFSFIARKGLIRDHAFVDSLTIEACYPPELSDVWAGFVAAEAACVMRSLEEKLGPFPYQNLRIAPAAAIQAEPPTRQMVTLPEEVTDHDLIRALLAVQISQCWFTPWLSDSTDYALPYAYGLAYFSAITALYDMHGSNGYGMIEAYENWYNRYADTTEAYRSLAEERLRTVPRLFYGLSWNLGERKLWRAIRLFIETCRYRHPVQRDLTAILNSAENEQHHDILFERWRNSSKDFTFPTMNDTSPVLLPLWEKDD